MAEAKPRHIDYYPDEFISGVAAKLPYDEQGMYWMICSLIMSHGGPIENDIDHLARLGCLSKTKALNLLDKLIKRGKIIENGGILSQKRSENEVKKAIKRIEIAQNNGAKGGRPTNENKDLKKPTGLFAEKLTTNHQPPTTKEYSQLFSEWWKLYPKKSDKQSASNVYEKITKNGTISHEDLLKKTKLYISHCKKTETFHKGAWRWLKDARYEDEYETTKQGRMRL